MVPVLCCTCALLRPTSFVGVVGTSALFMYPVPEFVVNILLQVVHVGSFESTSLDLPLVTQESTTLTSRAGTSSVGGDKVS